MTSNIRESKQILLNRFSDKLNGDLMVISNFKDLFKKDFSHIIDDYVGESNLDCLAESITVVSSDLFTLKEVLNIDIETINEVLLKEFELDYEMVQKFNIQLEVKSYKIKKLSLV
ncbi:hypothetical protein [Staphylococcus phage vB_StaM_SA1]|nr:hypothetical protein [Staphylococcus phage vB_StaM_SA1]